MRLLFAAALLAGALAAPLHAAPLLTNGGFETGFSGWTRADQLGSDGTFVAQTGTSSPVNAFVVPPPPQGTFAAMTDAAGPGSHVLYQDFVVPAGAGPFFVTFSTYVNNTHGAAAFYAPATLDFATPALNQQARVDLITTAADPFSVAPADVLQNLFATLPGDPLQSGYITQVVDVTTLFQARTGQTIRLRFAEADNVAPFNFGVDNVAVVGAPLTATKSVSGTFFPGSTVTYTVTLTNGSFAQSDNAGNEFSDVLPAQLTLVSANATSGTAVATVGTNTVNWNGALAPGATVTITITATINNATPVGTTVSNQGTASPDTDSDGTNDAVIATDDPAVAGLADPTQFVVAAASAPNVAIPASGDLGLLLIVLSLAMLAAIRLR